VRRLSLLLLGCLLAPPLWADVGYDPRALGQTTAKWYTKDAAGKLISRQAAINFLAVPSTLHGSGARQEFERRWGVGSFTRFRWQGPDNELTATVKAALEWACSVGRGELLGWQVTRPSGADCAASQIEVMDACATGHGGAIGAEYGKASRWPGSSPSNRIEVADPSRPPGQTWHSRNQYWPMTTYYVNTITAKPPPPPEPPVPEEGPVVCATIRVSYKPGPLSTGRLDVVLLEQGQDACGEAVKP
jgi:hypothetical protein